MSTPQDPPVRNKQKRRRTKKLAEWRIKNAAEKAGKPIVKKTVKSAVAKKAPKAAKPAGEKAAKAPAAKAPAAKASKPAAK